MKFTANTDIKNEFTSKFRVHKNFIDTPEGKILYEIVVTDYSVLKAIFVTEELGLPAITAVASPCYEAIKKAGGELNDTHRKFIGSLMCSLMEANGYRKKRRPNGDDDKRAVPHPAYKTAQVYERQL